MTEIPENTGEKTAVTFRVSRTTLWADDVAPCPEAYKGTYTEHAYCTLPLAEAMDPVVAPMTGWFRDLTNHRKAPGGSVADRLNTPCWFVDIDGLAGLQAFIGRYGMVVVDWPSDGPTIDIYDGYRE